MVGVGTTGRKKRGKINVIKLIENSFGINSSELGAIGNRVLGRSVLVFFHFFFLCRGEVLCVYQWNNRSRSKSSVHVSSEQAVETSGGLPTCCFSWCLL